MGDGGKTEDKEQDTLAAKDRLQVKPIWRGKKGTESGQSGRQVKIKPSKTEEEGEKLNTGSRRRRRKKQHWAAGEGWSEEKSVRRQDRVRENKKN